MSLEYRLFDFQVDNIIDEDIEEDDENPSYKDNKKFDIKMFAINENGERTPFGEKKRMMVRTHENLFIDVYLKDELPTHNFYKLKNGKTIKIADIEDYKKHYGDMMSNYDFKKYDLDGRFINKIINYTNLF